MSPLKNKVAIVTGASSGLGRATAIAMAKQGATICLAGRKSAALEDTLQILEEFETKTHIERFDVGNHDAGVTAIENCVAEFGKIDILANIAGSHKLRKTTEITTEQWQEDLDTNLSGPFYLCQAAIPHLLNAKGAIVNVSSIAGLQGQAYSAAYCAAKHGILGLTRALALEYINTDLRINAICPGGMDTAQVSDFKIPENTDLDLIMRSSGLRGLASPENVANAICFLASDQAKAIHGAVLPVDQGKTVG